MLAHLATVSEKPLSSRLFCSAVLLGRGKGICWRCAMRAAGWSCVSLPPVRTSPGNASKTHTYNCIKLSLARLYIAVQKKLAATARIQCCLLLRVSKHALHGIWKLPWHEQSFLDTMGCRLMSEYLHLLHKVPVHAPFFNVYMYFNMYMYFNVYMYNCNHACMHLCMYLLQSYTDQGLPVSMQDATAGWERRHCAVPTRNHCSA